MMRPRAALVVGAMVCVQACASLDEAAAAEDLDLRAFAAAARGLPRLPSHLDEWFRSRIEQEGLLWLAVGPVGLPPDGPDIDGEVVFVDGDIVVLKTTRDDADPRGATLSLYSDIYAGEAAVVLRRGGFVACRVVKRVRGTTIQVGFHASANVPGS